MVKQHKTLDPIGIGPFGAQAVMLKPDFIADLIQELGALGDVADGVIILLIRLCKKMLDLDFKVGLKSSPNYTPTGVMYDDLFGCLIIS